MNIAVAICSAGRPKSLHETIVSVLAQEKLPSTIIVSSPDISNVLPETMEFPLVRFVESPLGLCKQRNRAIDVLSSEVDIVAFLDDDVELTTTYLARMDQLFVERAHVLVASGFMLHDGGRSTFITRPAASSLCRQYETAEQEQSQAVRPIDSGYGCNMLIRRAAMGIKRFDENLPLYAWLEDRDYSVRCAREGSHVDRMVELKSAALVHLGSRAAKVSGVRMGYSSIINPLYLLQKSGIFSLRYVVVNYWLRCLMGNVLGIMVGDKDYDRVGLLKGNILGLWHGMTRKPDPTYILKL